jgi:hypothetical protein
MCVFFFFVRARMPYRPTVRIGVDAHKELIHSVFIVPKMQRVQRLNEQHLTHPAAGLSLLISPPTFPAPTFRFAAAFVSAGRGRSETVIRVHDRTRGSRALINALLQRRGVGQARLLDTRELAPLAQ